MCRQLGFPATGTIIIIIIMIRHFSLSSPSLSLSPLPLGAVAVGLAHYGQGDGPIVLDNVACNGLETYITDCHNNGYYVHNCAHAEDAGVQCAGIVYQS